MTTAEVRAAVQLQIAWALWAELKGGERIMKECWEQLDGDEFETADHELARIIESISPGFLAQHPVKGFPEKLKKGSPR